MRVLLLHPAVSALTGRWALERWDMIVDLGCAGPSTYSEWSRTLNTRIFSIHEYAGDLDSYRWVKRVFDHGRGKLLDRMGLDWWDLLCVANYHALHVLWLFQRLKTEIGGSVEIWCVRPHEFARVAEQVFGPCRGYFQDGHESLIGRGLRAVQSARDLRPAQIIEIAFDKWDPGYRIRRYWTQQSRARLAEPAMLLPSAYSNVTISELAYATQLPERRFLLATTRHNAIPDQVPENITIAPLAAYAKGANATADEVTDLKRSWEEFSRAMASEHAEFRRALDAGLWNYVRLHLEEGLLLREAWNHLLDSEPVTGVLCGDDLNYHTRLPLLLAQRRGLNAVYCSHGALDGGFLFKTPIADYYLVKGAMERDYLERVSAVSVEKIVVGAPNDSGRASGEDQRREAIAFFSQPYEIFGGRVDCIYREILPHVYSAAQRSGRKIIVKLHPFESKRARQKLLDSILPQVKHSDVEIVQGKSAEEVLANAWCGITVDSSVAVEGARRKVPFFLCGWLDFAGLGYLDQFARFGVAQVLNSPEELQQIPEKVADYQPDAANLNRFWQQADPIQIDEILFGNRHARSHSSVC